MAAGGERKVVDIHDRDEVRGRYAVLAKTLRLSRAGKPYLTLDLGDRTGRIEGRVWDGAEAIDERVAEGDVVAVLGQATSYQGRLQLNIHSVETLPPEAATLEDLLPASEFPLDEMLSALREVAASVSSEPLRELLVGMLSDDDLGVRLRIAPAAKAMHHAYLGGLVEHSLSMCRVLERLYAHYERLYPGLLDRDLLLAGGILHDIGKLVELSVGAAFNYTDDGRLLGHLIQGTEMITARAARIPDFPPDLLVRLKHLILAHHGKLEFGSPKVPHMAEAYVLHIVDLLDARLNAMHDLFLNERSGSWTGYSRMMETFLLNPYGADEESALPARTTAWLADPQSAEAVEDPSSTTRRRKAPKDDGEEGPRNLDLF